jgi:hypothetical protein
MRTTPELIAELDKEGTQHRFVALVVAFENSTVPIPASDENRLKLLNDAVNVGGSPIGLIAFDQSGQELTIITRVYPEYSGDEGEQANLCLEALSQKVGETLAAQWGIS